MADGKENRRPLFAAEGYTSDQLAMIELLGDPPDEPAIMIRST
jgi:hypothetical protein